MRSNTRCPSAGVKWLPSKYQFIRVEVSDAAGTGSEQPGPYAVLGEEVGLTPRETDILRLLTLGMSNQQIADESFLSVNSVKSYIRSAYRRIGATSRSQAVVWCIQHGFEPPSEDDVAESSELVD